MNEGREKYAASGTAGTEPKQQPAPPSESPPPRVSPDEEPYGAPCPECGWVRGEECEKCLERRDALNKAIDQHARQAKRIATLEAERDEARLQACEWKMRTEMLQGEKDEAFGHHPDPAYDVIALRAESAALRAQVAALVEALQPFAEYALALEERFGREIVLPPGAKIGAEEPVLLVMEFRRAHNAIAAPSASAAALLERVRAEERERCAKIAETRADACGYKMPVWGEPDPEHYIERHHEALSIAAAIRAGEPGERAE